MTSDANVKLPIATYAPHVIGDAYLEMDEELLAKEGVDAQ